MKKSLFLLVTTAMFGISSIGGVALAHTVTDSAGHAIKHKTHVKAKHRKANSAMKQASAGKPVASPASLPAVQTQSPAVSATGVAQTPVGPDLTPGKPAMLGK